jgi:uncharacterized coiled-coil protein SlyX
MIFDELDFSELPANREEAFTNFVKAINAEYAQNVRNDRISYSDQHGHYEGSYEPERSFVTAILAFLDEYGIESDIADISDLSNQDFSAHFGRFKSKVEYLTTRFKLRQHRIQGGGIGTLISIGSDYKSEIGKLLDTARKIVNQEIKDTNKKDNIIKRIASLQSEVDRDQTTVDALFGRMLDLTQTIGKSADNLVPLLEKLERVKKLFWDNSKKVEQLPKPDRPKLITKDEPTEPSNDIVDEIPF